MNSMDRALAKYGYVYDIDKQDIFMTSSEKDEANSQTSTSSRRQSNVLSVGDSYTFKESDYSNSTGLKITVSSVTVDKSLQLNSEYSTQDFTGLVPVVVKTTFENTTSDYIDITSFSLLASNGNMGKWNPYLEGISTGMPDGLNAGQNVEMVQVYGSPSETNFDLTYDTITWRVK